MQIIRVDHRSRRWRDRARPRPGGARGGGRRGGLSLADTGLAAPLGAGDYCNNLNFFGGVLVVETNLNFILQSLNL